MKNYEEFNLISENQSFKVGDNVHCKSSKFKNLTGEIVFVDDSHFDNYTVKLDHEIRGKLFFCVRSNTAEKITQDERERLNKEFYREKEELDREKEELRSVYLDIDPYGEEDWND